MTPTRTPLLLTEIARPSKTDRPKKRRRAANPILPHPGEREIGKPPARPKPGSGRYLKPTQRSFASRMERRQRDNLQWRVQARERRRGMSQRREQRRRQAESPSGLPRMVSRTMFFPGLRS